MQILNKELIEKYIKKNISSANALNRWVEMIEQLTFSNHNELKLIFPSVDYIGKSRYVFNIKGNDYRLVAVVLFAMGTITVCFIGTHSEYDKVDCLTVFQ